MQNDDFLLLINRKIIDILIGDVIFEEKEEYKVQMPYLSGPALCTLSTTFGLPTSYPTSGGAFSRWQYMEKLITHVVKERKINDLLSYLFSFKNFNVQLQHVHDNDKKLEAYKNIIKETLAGINAELFFINKKLYDTCGQYYIINEKEQNVIDVKKIKLINIPYIQELNKRIENDMSTGAYDGVITKSRTLIEEVLIAIIEQKCEQTNHNGDILKLHQIVKNSLGMQQSNEKDKRINAILSGLEKIIQSITEMRNTQGDAHGAGQKRIKIRKHEAQLIANSAMTFSSYIFSVFEFQRDTK